MEQFIQARAAINRIFLVNGSFDKLVIGLCVFTISSLFFIRGVTIQTLVLAISSLIFGYMMQEDFHFQTVDMRVWLLLFITMIFGVLAGANTVAQFLIGFLIGFVVFRLLCIFSCQIQKPVIVCSFNHNSQKAMGFLPSLGLGIGSWILIKNMFDIPLFMPDFLQIFTSIMFSWCGVLIGIIILLVFVFGEYRLQKAVYDEKEIVYGFGDGDVFVCAAWMGFLGIETFFIAFCISLLIQLLFYVKEYFL